MQYTYHSFIHYVIFCDDTYYNLIVVSIHSKQNITNLEFLFDLYIFCVKLPLQPSATNLQQLILIFYYFWMLMNLNKEILKWLTWKQYISENNLLAKIADQVLNEAKKTVKRKKTARRKKKRINRVLIWWYKKYFEH